MDHHSEYRGKVVKSLQMLFMLMSSHGRGQKSCLLCDVELDPDVFCRVLDSYHREKRTLPV